MVVGPTGSGKTLLCNLLAEDLHDAYRVVMLLRGGLSTRRALLQAILYELCQPYRGMDEGELRLAVSDYVTLNEECPQGILLIVDEAHTLPIRLLDEIRLLTNLAYQGQTRVRLVLAGGAGLEERFATPKLDSFSQRIVVRCYLEAFQGTETQEYIHRQLSTAGGRAAEIFPSEACQSVQRATDGVPRLVNQLCDHAMLLAYSNGKRTITPGCVEEAWADLQQLPTPWNADEHPQPESASVVEFGGLDDEEPVETEAEAPDDALADVSAESLESQSPVTFPLIRAAQDDEPATDRPEPLEQLDRIESALSELDEDFQPAGTIGPEVELVFADPGNPFSEPFEEEEIVVDRPTRGASRPEPRPAVRHEVLVAPTPMGTHGPKYSSEPSFAVPAPREAEPEEAELALPPEQEPAAPQAAVEPAAQEPTSGPSEPSTVPMHRDEPEPSSDDSDMIVVEEGYEDSHCPVPRPATAIRHQEYRRLFAKLRYGH